MAPELAISNLRKIRSLLPDTDEFNSLELPYAVQRYINRLGARASNVAAAEVEVRDPGGDEGE